MTLHFDSYLTENLTGGLRSGVRVLQNPGGVDDSSRDRFEPAKYDTIHLETVGFPRVFLAHNPSLAETLSLK